MTPTERRALADRLEQHAFAFGNLVGGTPAMLREAAAALREPVIAVTPERTAAIHHAELKTTNSVHFDALHGMLAEAREATP